MGRVRIRWRSAAPIGAVALAGLLALALLPGLLKPPDPPPLAADVGLPRGVGKRVEVTLAPVKKRSSGRDRHQRARHRPSRDDLRSGKQGEGRRRKHRPRRRSQTEADDPPPPSDLPTPAPAPAPTPVTVPPPVSQPPPAPTPEPDATREFGLP